MFVAPSVSDLQEALPQFEILEILGQGGMGAVYKALQPRLNRHVAIKLLPPLLGPDEHNYTARFEGEAQAMARMNHPNIVTVHDFGETDGGLHYIVMEAVDGSDLHSLIHGAELKKEHVLSWIPQICSALQYAHEHGLVHRDIKPANILISKDGEAKVVDFGLAKLVDHKAKKITQLTRPDVAMGTADYAAPEAMEPGAEVDNRADIYSLGVLFYEMLTGKVPRGAWKPPSKLNKDVDSRFDAIIVKAMQPNADDRYQSVAQISQALAEIQRSPQVAVSGAKKLAMGVQPTIAVVHGPKTSQPIPPERSGSSMGAWIAISVAIVGVLVGGFLVLGGSGDDDRRGQVRDKGKDKGKDKGGQQLLVNKGKDKGKGKGKGTEPRPPKVKPATPPPDPLKEQPLPATAVPDPLPDGFANAFADLNVKRAGYVGAWRLQRKMVECRAEGGQYPQLEIPTELSKVYQINAAFHRSSGDGDIVIVVPVGEGRYAPIHYCAFNGQFAGIAGIDRRPLNNAGNPTRQPSSIENGRVQRTKIYVQTAGEGVTIGVDLDGKKLFDWSGQLQQLPADDTWKPRDPSKILVGATDAATFLNVHVDPGEGAPTSPAPPVDSLKSIGGEWVNLLQDLDIELATIAGEWVLASDTLRRGEADIRYTRLEFPQQPGPNYDLEFTLQIRRRVEDVQVNLPIGNQVGAFHLAAYGEFTGLAPIERLDLRSPQNPTRQPAPIEVGETHQVSIQVRKKGEEATIRATVDGIQTLDWTGQSSQLGPNPNWEPRNPKLVSFGSVVPAVFSNVRMRSDAPPGPAPIPSDWENLLTNFDVKTAAVAGAWSVDGETLVRETSQEDYPRVEFPRIPGADYDLAFTVKLTESLQNVAIKLPVAGEIGVLHLAGSSTFVSAIAPLDGLLLSGNANPTILPTKLQNGQNHRVSIQVRASGDPITIQASIDGAPIVDWAGSASSLGAHVDWASRDDNLIAIGASAPSVFSKLQLRSGPPRQPTELELKLIEIAESHEARISADTADAFTAAVATLNQSYRGALEKILAGTDANAVTYARSELVRIEQNRPIEADDPADMPASVTMLRAVYRREIAKRELARDVKALPIIREQLLATEALKTDRGPAEVKRIQVSAVEPLLIRISEIEKNAAIAGMTISQAPTTATPPQATSALKRLTIPLPMPEKTGAVVAWDRTDANRREGMGRVPGGLSQKAIAIGGNAELAAAIKENGRVEVWGTYEYGIPEQDIKSLDDAVRVEVGSSSSMLHISTLDREGNVRIVSSGWTDATTFEAQAHSLKRVVDIVTNAGGGLALHDDGKVSVWGDWIMPTSPLEKAVKLYRAPFLDLALLEDGSVVAWNENSSSFPAAAGKIRDIALGSQSDQIGGVLTLVDGSYQAFGAFAPWQADLTTLADSSQIRKVVGGYYAFAVEIGTGLDYEWRFFGQGIEKELSADEARGCSNLVIGREYIVGFRPS